MIGGLQVMLVTTGMGMRRSRIAAARAMDSLAPLDLVVISGVAGALREDLKAGQVVLGERLLYCRPENFQPEQIVEAPRQLLAKSGKALDEAGISYATGTMMTLRRPLMSAADKRSARHESGAISVDMESAVIAVEAQRCNLPFIVMRTILDPAGEDIIGAQLADEDGHVRAWAAAKALITNPHMLLGTARLLGNLRRATRALACALEAVLPRVQPR